MLLEIIFFIRGRATEREKEWRYGIGVVHTNSEYDLQGGNTRKQAV